MNNLEIVELSSRPRDVKRFLKFPHTLYPKDSCWVAPLLIDSKRLFSKQNPFFQHAEMRLWVVTSNDLEVGRIAGIIDRAYNEFHQGNFTFFGFFECVRDKQASHLLFEAVFAWARKNKMQRVVGPVNLTTNHECGLLIDGFDTSPAFMMPYNPPYYMELVADAGFRKAKDLLAYQIDLAHAPLSRYDRVVARFRHRQKDLSVRALRKRNLELDLIKIKEVYNEAWEKNWGFVPMTQAEINFMAARLKPIFEEGFIWIAEIADEPVGMAFGTPDYNKIFKELRGHLLSPKIWSLLSYLLGLKKLTRGRMMTLGVKKNFRGRGIEAAMLAEFVKYTVQVGYKTCEASWILEDNVAVQRVIELFGGVVYKKFRIYEYDL